MEERDTEILWVLSDQMVNLNKVLYYIATIGPNDSMYMKNLTKKVVMLLAIPSEVRGQNIYLLDKKNDTR